MLAIIVAETDPGGSEEPGLFSAVSAGYGCRIYYCNAWWTVTSDGISAPEWSVCVSASVMPRWAPVFSG